MFYNQLCALCSQTGTTPTAFVTNELKLSSSKVTAWKNGSIPKYGILEKISKYFDVPISFLFEEGNVHASKSSSLSNDEQDLLINYRELNNEGQRLAADYVDTLVVSGKYKKTDNVSSGNIA